MNNRWKMNRIGFINFWLYDEEVFDFADGKLLLRGANASGKSITTQSFIPFILDGDKSPERLDPFGSKDRRMEYYFLGNGEREDVTGYLFLEFKKAGTDQYRTIGIGQRAQRGKAMTFWGFVLRDGRRIGYDFNLYKEAGSKKMPLSRLELSHILGDQNPLKTSQREYMEMVNQYIFGFPRIDQYDQFVKLMIKVRAPKLSRDFKPSKVCEILNESLQILSDEDIRTMVEAMEKIEDIQTKLEGLRTAFKDAGFIKREYDRYNQFILGKKAQVYIGARDKKALIEANLAASQQEFAKNTQTVDQLAVQTGTLSDRNETLEHERTTLASVDLENSVQKLQQSRGKVEALSSDSSALDKNIEKYQEDLRGYDVLECTENKNLADAIYQIDAVIKDLNEINEILQFSQHECFAAQISHMTDDTAFMEMREQLKNYRMAITHGLEALRQVKEVRKKWDFAEETVSAYKIKQGVKAEQYRNAVAMETQARDVLQDQFFRMEKINKQLCFTQQEMRSMIELIEKYQSFAEAEEIKKIVNTKHSDCYSRLISSKLEIENQYTSIDIAYQEALTELETLKEAKDLPPQRQAKVDKARKILASHHIVYRPFYEVVEFGANLSSEACDLLEEQLADAGILDALVVAKGDLPRAQKLLREASDTLLTGQGVIQMFPFDKLVAGNVEPELKEMVEELLLYISAIENEDVAMVLSETGYFRNGIITGHSVITQNAVFIGVQARQKERLRKISEKETACADLLQQMGKCREQLETAQKNLLILATEYQQVPSFSDLNQGLSLVKDADYELQKAIEELAVKEAELEQILAIKKVCEQEVIVKCKNLPFERTCESYTEGIEAADEYGNTIYRLGSQLNMVKIVQTKLLGIEEQRENKAEALASESRQQRRISLELNKYKGEIKQLEEFLNKPETQAMAKQLEAIIAELQKNNILIRENEKKMAALQSELRHLSETKEQLQGQLLIQTDHLKYVYMCYEEELALEFCIKVGDRSPKECAKEALTQIRAADTDKSIVEITSNLLKIYQQHNSNLSSYGISVEDCFAESAEQLRRRQRIVAVWQGNKLSFMDFYNVIKEAIDSTELLIQDKDRKLFEDILTDTLSRKLNSRILESRNWIRDMSALMEHMDTSMGLTFSIDWKPQKSMQEAEIDTIELEKLLNRDRNLLTKEDIEKVSTHFRNKISTARRAAVENDIVVNYSDLIRDALDYRKWFDLKLVFRRSEGPRKELTNNFFNTFSGGEKAMAMYVPLFAAVSSQYKKAEKEDCPRLVALDEAFAGVDEKNISSMFTLINKLDFDYIMHSQALWGCYESVKSIKIAELLRPANSSVVTVIFYHWNGKERILDDV
ncbi:TIGR02680 family protein [Propionispira arboris]|uniref:TIGR02680 family protein n=1 Tax=Propionispira arboris TaxID=84035 RepID=A0A1H6WP23_9FIRM|nr:TIGR02680 family protein [Propionispira arboris]SEJ16934.1 TIGR02680 family protein [Propionispira arboris]